MKRMAANRRDVLRVRGPHLSSGFKGDTDETTFPPPILPMEMHEDLKSDSQPGLRGCHVTHSASHCVLRLVLTTVAPTPMKAPPFVYFDSPRVAASWSSTARSNHGTAIKRASARASDK